MAKKQEHEAKAVSKTDPIQAFIHYSYTPQQNV